MADKDKNKTTRNILDTVKNVYQQQQQTVDKANSGMPSAVNDTNLIGIGGGGKVYRAADDILAGSRYQKYDNVQHLEGQQQQYRPQPKKLKTINFKQDYVVLIRKKLYYAANAVSNEDTTMAQDKTVGKGHYIRTYRVDCFTNLSTSCSVHGQSPGTCNMTIKGAERVMCYEHTSPSPNGTPTVEQLVNGMWPDNSAQIVTDATNNVNNVLAGSPIINTTNTNSKIDNLDILIGTPIVNPNSMPQTSSTSQTSPDKVGAAAQSAERELNNQLFNRTANTMSWESDTMTNQVDVKLSGQGVFTYNGQQYDMHTRESTVTTFNQDGSVFHQFQIDAPPDMTVETPLGPPTQWKFVEKCDWEEMDEVWVFGKSNFERNNNSNGKDFKMNQIFFGYIDTVAKSYVAGTNGCMVTISASDQLKILGLSYVTQNPSIAMGASLNGQGIDIKYGYKDVKAFGTMVLADPYAAMQATGGKSLGAQGTSKQAEQAEAATYACFAYTNIFAGMTAEEIIRQCCEDAGVPSWYMTNRIESIGWPPYVMKIKQFTADMMFQMSTKKRLAVCQEVARQLQIEFFADERGNIVLKCPNYALGVNKLPDNNMGLPELAGGMLHQIKTYQVTSAYWAINETDLNSQNIDEATGTDKESMQDASQSEKKKAAYDAMVNARNQWRAAVIADGFLEKFGEAGIEPDGAAAEINRMMDGWSESTPVQQLVYNRILSSQNGVGKTREVIDVVNGNTEYGNTLGDIAWHAQTWYDGMRWDTILSDPENAELFAGVITRDANGNITNPDDAAANFYKCSGKLVLNYNPGIKTQAVLEKEYYEALMEYNKYLDVEQHKTQQDYDSMKRRFYENTLSELTDALIPEIPQEFILSFTLTTSDKNVFNSYEVNIESDFGLYDGANTPITKLSRVYADIPSFIRFGVRPCPQTFNFPYMGNRENAHILGYMLCARSLAQRNSATLNMIEDSFIRVGDPIRFFAYDEHPYKPLASQEVVAAAQMGITTDSASALNIMGRENTTLSEANNTVNSESLIAWQQHNINAVASALQHSAEPQPKQLIQDENGDTGTLMNINAGNGGMEIPIGDAINMSFSGESPAGSTYKGIGASYAAMQTQAQTIYYVEAINRQITLSGVSKMTLNLSCGRMMGCPSVVDYMLLLYKAYYDANTGFAPDLNEISELRNMYQGNTTTYELTIDDTLKSIGEKQYGIDYSALEDEAAEDKEMTDEDLFGPYALTVCSIDNRQAHDLAQAQGWRYYSSKTKGNVYVGQSPHAQIIGTFTYYEYDGSNGNKAIFHLESNNSNELVQASRVNTGNMMAVCITGESAHASSMGKTYISLTKKEAHITANREQMPMKVTEANVSVEMNDEQKKLIHLARVLAALNPQAFGNSLTLTGEQIDEYIHTEAAAGRNLIVPNSLNYSLDPMFREKKE